ncbi:uncharacterized protein LOC113361217 isoform X2 [Papaver somniferum]|uniref:uncharacterized protein LOC113361217 isoform X2 n=1 Tax=Papaver somniferum TaxID=3469 RepID=UPI000E6FCBB3|nr:uncharacterized protein LOC113361217 isoform X2 [Papaver somniferum]
MKFNNNDEFRVPDCVFTCKSLTNLELDLSTSYKIILPNSISLPRLKYLRLRNTRFKHDELTKLCSSCPVLEHLDLSGVRSTKPLSITISSVTLEHLVIGGISTTAAMNITISSVTLKNFELHIDKSIRNTLRLYAPNLVYLFLSNLDYLLFEDVSSLFKADVGVQVKPRKPNDEFPMVHAAADTLESLKPLHNVKELTISFQELKHVGRVEELLQKQPFHIYNLQRLELQKMSLSTESVHVIASLLKISPVLESLVVQLCQDVENSDKSESDEASDFGSESEEEMELALHSGEKLVLKKDPTGSSIEDITKFCEEVDKFPVACLSLKIYFFFFNL